MLELDFTQPLGQHTLTVNASLPAQGTTAIFGVSGAGKTSLINAVAGLTRPARGRIALNGRTLFDAAQRLNLPPEKRRIGYVFQDARLFPHYRVKGNLRYALAPGMKRRFDELVVLLGLEKLLDRFPHTLSGGEKQRVAIARALLSGPELLLMDEPLAALDLPRKREVLPYLQRLSEEVQTPVLYVSHSLEEIMQLADHVLVLDEGEVKACGELEAVWASPVMRRWLPPAEQCTLLSVQVAAHHPLYAMTALGFDDAHVWVKKVDLPLEHPLRIRINASDVSLTLHFPLESSIRNVLSARIVELLDVDEQVEVKLAIGKQTLWARITPWARDELGLKPGLFVYAQIKSVSILP